MVAECTMSLENSSLYIFPIGTTSAVSSYEGSKEPFSTKKKGMWNVI